MSHIRRNKSIASFMWCGHLGVNSQLHESTWGRRASKGSNLENAHSKGGQRKNTTALPFSETRAQCRYLMPCSLSNKAFYETFCGHFVNEAQCCIWPCLSADVLYLVKHNSKHTRSWNISSYLAATLAPSNSLMSLWSGFKMAPLWRFPVWHRGGAMGHLFLSFLLLVSCPHFSPSQQF